MHVSNAQLAAGSQQKAAVRTSPPIYPDKSAGYSTTVNGCWWCWCVQQVMTLGGVVLVKTLGRAPQNV